MNNKKSMFCFREGSFLLGSRTYIMGIINITPDSFSDGGDNFLVEDALKTAKDMFLNGADILDIGAQSTRPGHIPISPDEEWKRLKKVLPLVLNEVDLPISIDTFYPEVAEKALKLGCHIINDVSGCVDFNMAEIVKKHSAGWILMHSGEEENDDICQTVFERLLDMKNTAVSFGVNPQNLCFDPGIGFGKTTEQNYSLIANINKIKIEDNGILLGASRKRVIGSAIGDTDLPFKERDFGTVAAHTIGILGGADILRVHNVKAHVQAARLVDTVRKEV